MAIIKMEVKEKMKYPISLNEKDLENIQELGKLMGIDNVMSIYGGVPKVIKFSISLAIQTIERSTKDIPLLEPKILQTFLSMIERKKTGEYLRKRKEFKESQKIGITSSPSKSDIV